MHFKTLYILKNEKLEDWGLEEIENDFCDRFCCCNGETTPKYVWWCDWFQIGGRWSDHLEASRGIKGEPSWALGDDYKVPKNHYSIVEIKDLIEPIDPEHIYAVALRSKVSEDEDYVHEMVYKINNKLINGVIALIDCHN